MANQQAQEQVLGCVRKAFEEMDQDGSGKVDSAELRAYCKKIPGMDGIAEALCEIDTSDDGKITLEELNDFIVNKAPKDKIEECHVTRLFDQLDASGDGKLNKTEFSTLLKSAGYGEEDIDTMLKEIGGDDGIISKAEFLTAFKNS